ncbi:Zinc finger, C2H2 domain and Zinc finger C2H2-type/integrase DNA-binding domain and Zinc finger, C2H2-like domain-containing protein [Strongyloides ratti]|uniref:Zinc finger, C2H2 domain and Zinc finger C2H2-type/integrase DNA-binding domain and Zinc finger, C2H2-like domain-containing protein n=1 Tax=Strongyloides ratti TaxID=34506 RepID=A0A090L6S1_STRRB|nr:Zinc finger, C2H2 domain and Zinc finger C2H2-type/integrase DNA-binding domain and Zinc finger, C2H2-like domain-containing protein [Strongyloides ratti]CEF63803.1 Zinc finger, C2H2 domain and Zinc finger C2H2-type/integrase DNA-binding domain and Zinc finger, C2H2-like domain-containing protein [Strongyloides ratti]
MASNEPFSTNVCYQCNKRFSNAGACHLHLLKTHKIECTSTSDKKLQNRHKFIPTSSDTKKIFICNVSQCKKTFKNNKLLKQHIGKVHIEKKFICEACNKPFGLERDLKYHIKISCILYKKYKLKTTDASVNTNCYYISKNEAPLMLCSETQTETNTINFTTSFDNQMQSSGCQTIEDWETIMKNLNDEEFDLRTEIELDASFNNLVTYVDACLQTDEVTDSFINFMCDEGTQTSNNYVEKKYTSTQT